MSNPRAYIPLHALRKIDLESILSIALPLLNDNETSRKYDHHHSRRTMLNFLLSIYFTQNNDKIMQLLNECHPKPDWERIKKDYNHLKTIIEPYKEQNNAGKFGDYWELTKPIHRSGPVQSREYIKKYREYGFKPEELKIYWNYNEIENLNKSDYFNPITDTDTNTALNEFPVNTRQNSGTIHFKLSGIENAVFDVPNNNQIIVLDFADERMPGGYFLENARTQEEVILYNSDGYRAILDLKYKVMDGGYILPEFGVAYIKNVRFFQDKSQQERLTDLIACACYDLSGIGEGLYKPPSREKSEDLYNRTYQKFQAIIASAVANTEGNGKITYLLLGPIGTGVFANDMRMIARIFAEILNQPLVGSKGPIKYAFEQIWFVSTDTLDIFVKEFEKYEK